MPESGMQSAHEVEVSLWHYRNTLALGSPGEGEVASEWRSQQAHACAVLLPQQSRRAFAQVVNDMMVPEEIWTTEDNLLSSGQCSRPAESSSLTLLWLNRKRSKAP